MPIKDYSNIDSVLQGAQMAMQAAGIKDKREQDTLMQKFREHQMSMDVQAGERAEMQAKINEMNAKTQREMFELNAEKAEWERAQAQAETMSKQLEEVRQSILRPSLADEMSKTNPDTKILTELLLALDKTPGGSTNIAKSFLGMGETPREVKPYFNKEGKVEYLPNNVKPPVGWTPYSKSDDSKTITWTTAANNLSKRFGSQDRIGNIIITEGLQNRHRLAQQKLVEFMNENVEPMDAVNKAEIFANNVESRYWQYIDAAKTQKQTEEVQSLFKTKYGYIPKAR